MLDRDGWRSDVYDFIVVGSGAGGGPLAANLAEAGYRVALIEAGGSDTPPSYEVPAFFPLASEDPALRWDFCVRHYDDRAQQERDPKARTIRDEFGIWYPRSGTLGGCTSHHALITICPHESDWEHIFHATGDETWRAANMRRYFERLERCDYVRRPFFRRRHPAGHGFTGWLTTNIARPKLLAMDFKLVRIAWATLLTRLEGHFWATVRQFWSAWRGFEGGPIEFLKSFFDPNDLRHAAFVREGIFFVPFSTECGRRVGVRDRLNLALQEHGDNLSIHTRTLVTRVLFDEATLAAPEGPKAIGVEVMQGIHLYGADPHHDPGMPPPIRQRLRARREVILAAGAFNSPQILMLSGIGPTEDLERVGIQPIVPRPGVGKNLQDRYEIGIVCQTRDDFAITRGATFRRPKVGEAPDRLFAKWLKGKGPYTTNGVIVCLSKKSHPGSHNPDLFIFCVPGVFRGYFPGWAGESFAKNKFSWLILKSHTHNRRGSVTLRSDNPQHTPAISFRYFHEGSPGAETDLDAVADGVAFVRRVNAKLRGIIESEVTPGAKAADRDGVRQYVLDEAWGHHASCTNAMGRPDEPNAVVDSRFRVIGTRGLRVVDASVFPCIPGFFIATPIFMIAEKASDVIIADAKAIP